MRSSTKSESNSNSDNMNSIDVTDDRREINDKIYELPADSNDGLETQSGNLVTDSPHRFDHVGNDKSPSAKVNVLDKVIIKLFTIQSFCNFKIFPRRLPEGKNISLVNVRLEFKGF